MTSAGFDRPSVGMYAGESREALAQLAAAYQRRHRPRWLVWLAATTLAGAAVFAVLGLEARLRARDQWQAAVADLAAVGALEQEWQALVQRERAWPAMGLGEKRPRLLSEMEELAVAAGLAERPRPPRQTSQERGGITVVEYHYEDMRVAALEVLLEWIRRATATIPGMDVTGLTLRPDAGGWQASVTFRRWERSG